MDQKLIIPENLEQWIVAYHIVSTSEYDFYLKDLPEKLIKIKIAISPMTKGSMAYIQTNENDFSNLDKYHAIADSPEEAVVKVLQDFIDKKTILHKI